MLANVLILTISLVLLVYWFRYTCLLLLRSPEVAAEPVSVIAGLGLEDVGQQLRDAGAPLDALEKSLAHDYQVLTYLLEHAPGLNARSIEERLLVLDYRAMRMWYRLTRTAAPMQARKALVEMNQVLRFLAHEMGARAEAQGRA
jgi:hypothetical protein